jgi:hypothetical protein
VIPPPHQPSPPFRCAIALALALCAALAGIARSDVVAVVSVKSTITMLDKSQATDIFLGRATHFPGGATATPIDQEGHLIREEFYMMLADQSPAQIHAYWSRIVFTGRGRPPQQVLDGIALKKILATDPTAIGYIDARDVDDSVRVLF